MFRFLAGAILALASGITSANAATVTPFLNGPTEVTAGELVEYSFGYTVDGVSGPYNRVYGSSTLKLDGATQESFPAAAQGFSDTISLVFEEVGEYALSFDGFLRLQHVYTAIIGYSTSRYTCGPFGRTCTSSYPIYGQLTSTRVDQRFATSLDISVTEVSAVPLPAAGGLLLAAIGGLGVARWRRVRT